MELCPHTKQSVYLLNGINTEICVIKFSDTILVSLNQINKIGTILLAKQPPNLFEDSDATPIISTLLGKDDPATHLYARALVEQIPKQYSLVLFLGLKSHIPEDVKLVVKMFRENMLF
ncbi:hypothetical protein LOD99_3841 [Oopsacas minuta]|uniref:Proteasome assembly chaperone 3 n=1 Tax=Oopsacas minuta TaxID=111878 RepID=A0AAV7JWT7_9METZ|nr:hypothetical protein LOD99_3841 [Oopsacas minuta]